jgi:MSHA biogenesis protein MshK
MSRILLCVLAALMPPAVQSANFTDPTRPPNVADNQVAAVAGGGPRLESVLIAPDRRLAVISGQQVRLGEKFGDGRVVRITASEVVIRSGDSTETLKLFPAVEKKLQLRRDKRPPQ